MKSWSQGGGGNMPDLKSPPEADRLEWRASGQEGVFGLPRDGKMWSDVGRRRGD